MAKNFSGTYSTTIQLSGLHPEYNPATITGTVITASGDGVNDQDQAWTVKNFGTIDGNQAGVRLIASGTVTNGSISNTASSITGRNAEGVRIGSVAGTVTNFGTIATTATSSAAIQLDFGGNITNGSSASTAASIIASNLSGIYVSNAAGTVTNFGSIGGFFGGVRLSAGGVIANKATGSITASNQGVGIYVGGAAGTVTNLGTISGSDGIGLGAGGRITNGSTASTTALIEASPSGTGITLGSAGGTVTNFGSISGYYGARLQFGGKVTNQLGARITSITAGGSGIRIDGGAVTIVNSGRIVGTSGVFVAGTATGAVTLTNAGTITGSGGTAVQLGGGDDRVIVAPGAVFNGAVLGGAGADTLVFTKTGAISLVNFAGFETIKLSSAGANTLTMKNANFAGVTGASIQVFGGAAGNTVNASALTLRRLLFTAGAGADHITSGAGKDRFTFSAANLTAADTVAGGAGADQLNVTTSGAIAASGVSGVEIFVLSGTGANTLTLANANFTSVNYAAIQVFGGPAGNTIDASALTGANRALLFGGAGADHFTGGAGNDRFLFSVANLTAADTATGGAGSDLLTLTTPGTIAASGVSGVETFELAFTGATTLTLTDDNFVGVIGATIQVEGDAGSDTVNASAVTGANRLVFVTRGGIDHLTGGAGNDVFSLHLTGADTVSGGAGVDQLQLWDGGTTEASGVSGVETFMLSAALANTLTLSNANFTGVTGASIHVFGGAAGNTVDASALTGANRLVFTAGAGADAVTGGAGNDFFLAGGNTTMTGGAGANRFTFDDIGTNSITDFAANAGNRIVLRDSGFDLGVDEGLGTVNPQHLDTSAFTANATGAFTTAGQRFVYNTTTGRLRYDRDGSGAAFGAGLVAVLTGHPSLAAGASGNLFFAS